MAQFFLTFENCKGIDYTENYESSITLRAKGNKSLLKKFGHFPFVRRKGWSIVCR